MLQRHGADPLIGQIVAGKYALVDLLGRGGFGAVYRAIQQPVGRAVAVKVIRRGERDNPEMRARFFREARVVAGLSHPATVTLHDYGEADGVLYMVFELIKGRALSALLAAEGPMAPKRAVDLTVQILGALSEAHNQGCVHRDLKPDNIMIAQDPWGGEQAKVLDFGIAKVIEDGQRAPDQITVETGKGFVLGTPRYMAPEQARSAGVDGRTDLYTLAVVLYEMLTGRAPFYGDTPLSVLLAHLNEPVPPIPERLGVPQPLQAALSRALSKRPDARPADAEAMARLLVTALPDAEGASRLGAPRASIEGRLETLPLPEEITAGLTADPAPVLPAPSSASAQPRNSEHPTPTFSGESPPPQRRASAGPWGWLVATAALLTAAGWWAFSDHASAGDASAGAGVSSKVAASPRPATPQPAIPSAGDPHVALPGAAPGAEPTDAEPTDAALTDVERPAAAPLDAGRPDTGLPDAGLPDAGRPDAAPSDAALATSRPPPRPRRRRPKPARRSDPEDLPRREISRKETGTPERKPTVIPPPSPAKPAAPSEDATQLRVTPLVDFD